MPGTLPDQGLGGGGGAILQVELKSCVLAFDKNLLHRLPCKVDRLEGFVMLWKKDANIITVGEQIIDKVRIKHT